MDKFVVRTTLTKTQALETYALAEKDLEGVPFESRRNKRSPAHPIRLYETKAVEEAAARRHGSVAAAQEVARVRSAKRDERAEQRRQQ